MRNIWKKKKKDVFFPIIMLGFRSLCKRMNRFTITV